MKKITIIALLALAVIAGFGGWYLYSADRHAPSFRTAAVERGDLQATISATGTIEPEEVVDVGSQVAGQIKELGADPRDSRKHIDYGSQVEEGTVLARIDATLYQTQVDQAKAQLA